MPSFVIRIHTKEILKTTKIFIFSSKCSAIKIFLKKRRFFLCPSIQRLSHISMSMCRGISLKKYIMLKFRVFGFGVKTCSHDSYYWKNGKRYCWRACLSFEKRTNFHTLTCCCACVCLQKREQFTTSLSLTTNKQITFRLIKRNKYLSLLRTWW